jgi:hypothetical protein
MNQRLIWMLWSSLIALVACKAPLMAQTTAYAHLPVVTTYEELLAHRWQMVQIQGKYMDMTLDLGTYGTLEEAAFVRLQDGRWVVLGKPFTEAAHRPAAERKQFHKRRVVAVGVACPVTPSGSPSVTLEFSTLDSVQAVWRSKR